MDSQDRVKIGDFGLATSHPTSLLENKTSTNSSSKHLESEEIGSKVTGKVGTALYVAPELCDASTRVKFSEKLDLYSLGVIFFEMCYKQLSTGMERVKVLGLIRKVSLIKC